MSENVASAGLMVPLNRKITDAERDEWMEILWDQGSGVHLNYEGTLAYTDEGGEEYGISFGSMKDYSFTAFKDLEQFGVGILPTKARPYTCYWYNGSDSDMDTMKLKDFLKRTNQND